MIGVSPGRVSQYISEKKLGHAELEGEGRAARVRIKPALQALRIRLDASQMTGNGIDTRLAAPAVAPAKLDAPLSSADQMDVQFKQAKLEEQLYRNRKAAEEEKLRDGIYMLADEARAETSKLAAQLLQGFEGGLADIATAIAAQYQLPQRDVVHMVRNQFRELRGKIAERLAHEGKSLPPLIEDDSATP